MGETVAPSRAGSKSAPSDAPAPRPVTLRGGKSAPSDAPAVRSTQPVTGSGSMDMPTSVQSNIVPPVTPVVSGKDAKIARSN